VDASVLVASLMADGSVRHLLLTSPGLSFSAPHRAYDEVGNLLPKIVARTDLPEAVVRAVLGHVASRIDLVPAAIYSGEIAKARRLAERADARGDEDYIALALAYDAPIWNLDKDFRRVRGVEVLETRAIRDLTVP
jgi:predicted nucleic acid-binding protein